MDAPDLDRLLEHSQWLRPMARSLVRDEHLAEDVLQETYLAAVRKPPQDAPLGAWMATVLRNAVRMHARKEGRRAAREEKVARPEGEVSRTNDQLELRMDLVHALLDVREPYRSTLILRFYDDLTPQEIADREGVPAATVRGRLKRGLDTLRERFEKRGRAGLLALLLVADLPGVDAATLWAEVETVRPDGKLVLAGGGGSPWLGIAAPVVLLALLIVALGNAAEDPRDASIEAPPTTVETPTTAGESPAVSTMPAPIGATEAEEGIAAAPVDRPPHDAEGGPVFTDPTPLTDPVTLVVVDRAGDPVVGAHAFHGIRRLAAEEIAASFPSTLEFLLRDPTPLPLGATDDRGMLRVERAILRTHPLAIAAPGHRTHAEGASLRALPDDRLVVTLDRPATTTLEVRSTDGGRIDRADVTITEGGAGSGRTLDALPRAPGTGADVWRTTVAIEGRIPVVSVRSPGLAAAQQLLSAPEHTIELPPGAPAVGRVVDPDGFPLVGAEVAVRGGLWTGPAARTTTDRDGAFTTIALPFGDGADAPEVSLVITHPAHPTLRVERTLPGENRDLGTFTLAAAHTLHLTVQDPSGRAVPGARILVFPGDRRFRSREGSVATADTDGFAFLDRLEGATILVRAEAPGWAPGETRISLEEDDPTACVVTLRPEHFVEGTVHDRAGIPVAGVPVKIGAVVGDELRGEVSVTDAEGRFRVGGLPRERIAHHPRRQVVRWGSLPDALFESPTGGTLEFALVELFPPHQLHSVEGMEIDRPAHFGSRNTVGLELARYTDGGAPLALVIDDPDPLPPLTFELVDRDGAPVLAHTNLLIASPAGWTMKDFAGLDGQPIHLPNPWVLDDAQVTVMARGHAWHSVRLDLRGSDGRVRFALPPLADDPATLTVEPARARELLVAPLLDGRAPLVAIPLGASDTDGTLSLATLGPGLYEVCTPLEEGAVMRSDGVRRRIAMDIDEVRVLGVVEVTGASGETFRLVDDTTGDGDAEAAGSTGGH